MSTADSHSSAAVSVLLVRTFFGLSLLFIGLAHYMTIRDFVTMVSEGLGPLEGLGTMWAYILPGLLVCGGVLYALGMYAATATWLTGIALGSIPAGLLLKPIMTGVPLTQAMPPAVNALVWVVVYLLVSKYCTNRAGG
jgi:hypothetical protein